MQPRQEQTSAPDASAGRIITDTFHDSHGWVTKSSSGYYNSGAPGSTVFLANDSQVPAQTVTTYDGAGRGVQSTFYSYAQPQWSTTTAYPGEDRTDVTPPSGTAPSTTITDVWGRPVQEWTYHTATPTGNAGDADVITTAYSADGRKLSVTDPTGKNQWTYSYDQRDRLIQTTDPDTGTSKVSYTPDGQVGTTTDGRGQVLAYTYDLLGRKTAEYDTSTSGTELTSWAYDSSAKGLADSSTRYSGGNAYISAVTGYTTSYKAAGTKVTIPAVEGKLAGTYTTSYTYTPNTELLDHVDLPAAGPLAAETIYYAYNLAGKLLQSGGNADYLTDQQYDSYGNPIRTTLGDMPLQAVQTSTYDAATGRQLTDTFNAENASNTLDTFSYTYDQAGLLTSATDAQLGGATDRQCFGYDYTGRLTTAWTDTGTVTTAAAPSVPSLGGCTNPAPTAATAGTQVGGPAAYWQTYGYDVTGNRTTDTQHDVHGTTANDVTRAYTYPAAGSPGSHSLACDTINAAPPASCPATADAGHDVYTYDASGNTKTRKLATGADQTMTYDQEGRLSGVTDATRGATTGYLYDSAGTLLIQRDPTDTVLYLDGQELHLNPKTGVTAANRYITTPGGATVVESSNGTTSYEMSNSQGTPVMDLAAANLSVTRRYYDPYGRTRGTAPSAWPDSHGFLDKPTDGTTGLDMVGARAYDPVTGRFLTRDPVFESSDPTQMGGYAYAGDSPASFSDPTGLTKCDIEPELCSARIQELSAEKDAAQAKADQAYADSVESDQFDRCTSGGCEQRVLKNWQDPVYAQTQVTNSFSEAEAHGEAEAAAEQQDALQAQQAQAAAQKKKHHHWWDTVTKVASGFGALVANPKGWIDAHGSFLETFGTVLSMASSVAAVGGWFGCGPCSAISLGLGVASAGAYFLAGDKAGAEHSLEATAAGLVGGGLANVMKGAAGLKVAEAAEGASRLTKIGDVLGAGPLARAAAQATPVMGKGLGRAFSLSTRLSGYVQGKSLCGWDAGCGTQ
jgi:RHS repeat-associated protein